MLNRRKRTCVVNSQNARKKELKAKVRKASSRNKKAVKEEAKTKKVKAAIAKIVKKKKPSAREKVKREEDVKPVRKSRRLLHRSPSNEPGSEGEDVRSRPSFLKRTRQPITRGSGKEPRVVDMGKEKCRDGEREMFFLYGTKKGKGPKQPTRKSVRKATEGEKQYTGEFVDADSPERDFTGSFFYEKGPRGTVFEGLVTMRSDTHKALYSCDVRGPFGFQDTDLVYDHRRLRDLIVPFDRLVGRTVTRQTQSGAVAKGVIKKYLGQPESLKGHKDERWFKVVYPDLEMEECLSNFKLLWRGGKEHQLDPLPHSGPSHPFKPRECIEMEGVDRMLLRLRYYLQGRSSAEEICVPCHSTVAVLKQCIWQKAEWREDWHPDKQIIMFGTRLLTNPNVVLEDLGIDHGGQLICDVRKMMKNKEKGVKPQAPQAEGEGDVRWEYEHIEVDEIERMEELAKRASSSKRRRAGGEPSSSWGKRGKGKKKYEHWSQEETKVLVDLVDDFFGNEEHLGKKFWERIQAKGGFTGRTPGDLRTKFRSLKKTARLDPKKRKGPTKKLPEDLLRKVNDLEGAKARRGGR